MQGNVQLITVLTSIAFLLGIIISVIIIKHTILRTSTVVNALEDIANGEGNLKTRLDENGRDEMAKLSRSFNHFVHSSKCGVHC